MTFERHANMKYKFGTDNSLEKVMIKILVEQINNELKRLSVTDQKIIQGIFYDGLSKKKVGEILGYS